MYEHHSCEACCFFVMSIIFLIQSRDTCCFHYSHMMRVVFVIIMVQDFSFTTKSVSYDVEHSNTVTKETTYNMSNK